MISNPVRLSRFASLILVSLLLTLPVFAQSVKSTRGQKPTTKVPQQQRASRQNAVKHLDKLDFKTTYQIWTEWYRAQDQGIKLPVPTITINVDDEREYNRLVAIWKQGQIKAEEDFRLRLAQAAKPKEASQLGDGGETDLTDQPSQITNSTPIPTRVTANQNPLPWSNQPKGIAGVISATTSPIVNPNPAPTQPSPVDTILTNNDGILDDLRKKEITANIAKAKAIADAANPMALSGANVSTKYLVDTNNVTGLPQVIEESQYVNGVLATVKQYTYGVDGLISQRQLINGQWVTSFFVKDGHGSIRMLTDANGNVTDTYDYDAFGNLVNITGNTPNNRLYAGEEFDLDLGFYYLRARYLNQATGRFLSIDPLNGNKLKPLSLHKYLYADANPVNNIDPMGRAAISQELSLRSVIATLPIGFISLRPSYDSNRTIRIDQLFYNTVPSALDGMRIELAAVARDSAYEEFRWVQEVKTNAPPIDPDTNKPVITPNVWALDREKPNRQANIPYYYDEATEQTIGSTSPGGVAGIMSYFKGYNKYFADEPNLGGSLFNRYNVTQIYASFTTYLVGVKPKGSNQYTPLASVDWGFKVNLVNPSTGETNVTLDPITIYNPK